MYAKSKVRTLLGKIGCKSTELVYFGRVMKREDRKRSSCHLDFREKQGATSVAGNKNFSIVIYLNKLTVPEKMHSHKLSKHQNVVWNQDQEVWPVL